MLRATCSRWLMIAGLGLSFLLGLAENVSAGEKSNYDKGVAAYEKKEYDRAITYFTAAIQDNPKDWRAYNRRGAAYQAKGDRDQESKDIIKANHLHPDFTIKCTVASHNILIGRLMRVLDHERE